MAFIVKYFFGFVVFILLCSIPRRASTSDRGRYGLPKGVNGGVGCLVCTAVVALTEQLCVIHNKTFVESYVRLCNILPDPYRNACVALGKFYIPKIIDLITDKVTPDVICHAIFMCYVDKGQPYCHAFPPKSDFRKGVLESGRVSAKLFNENENFYDSKVPGAFDPCTLEYVKDICKLFHRVFNNDLPLVDLDNDTYSALVEAWRGTSWRGRDCDDIDPLNHPGAKPRGGDVHLDSNCNGIHGTEPITGKPFEDLFCKDTGYLGVIVLGDSVAGHFHIPPEWLTARLITDKVFEHVGFIVENELDWPQLSLYSGYLKESRWPMERGHADSIYLKLWERNHCNHRDYQNLAKNGADSFEANYKLIPSMARDQKRDQPALVFYSFIGNDVCQGGHDLSKMTTPEQMHQNVMETLQSLDKRLPNGSHVILIGLVDGRILYDSMHGRIHPIGKLKGDVTYEKFYNFMNCLQISPCFGYLNTNETIRNETSKRAAQLTDVLKSVAETTKFENFDVYFFDCPLKQVMKKWEQKGHQIYELIEPVDGFHPRLKAEELAAKELWRLLESKVSHVLGNFNPKNFLIKAVFGNQGGY